MCTVAAANCNDDSSSRYVLIGRPMLKASLSITLVMIMLYGIVSLGCGPAPDDDKTPVGSDGGECYSNNTCDYGLSCYYGRCYKKCIPECGPFECGEDPVCGVSCGKCEGNRACIDHKCVVVGCSGNCGEMVEVPAGWFTMGTGDSGQEGPSHQVYVPAFFIDRFEVTMELYGRFLDDLGDASETFCEGTCLPDSQCIRPDLWENGSAGYPVNSINWYQAKAFCSWAGKRLCTEAEWEKAARGNDGRLYPWGDDDPTCSHASFYGQQAGNSDLNCDFDYPAPVGIKPLGASPYGVMDMSGNVPEWVEDDYHENYDRAPSDGSAWVDVPRGDYKVLRGRCWWGYDFNLRTTIRDKFHTNWQPCSSWSEGFGARCCSSD